MNRLPRFLLLAFLYAFSFATLAQESNCLDGIDNDGDNFVDCYDSDCSSGNDCKGFFFGNNVTCSEDPDVTNFSIKLQWASADQTANSHASPVVGDLDQDGFPEVVVNNFHASTLTILNGEDGTTYKQVALPFAPENTMTIGNILKDDCAWIFVSENGGTKIAAYDCELNLKWQATAPQVVGILGLADFNGDGNVELYHRAEIRNAQSGAVIVNGTSILGVGETWVNSLLYGAVAVDLLSAADGCTGNCDGLELVTGRWIYSVNIGAGTITKERDVNVALVNSGKPADQQYWPKVDGSNQWSTSSIADYNQDGHLDVLLSGALGTSNTSQTTVIFWDVHNMQTKTYGDPSNNHTKGTGRLNIADVDGNGQLNVNYVSNDVLYSLTENMTVLWTKSIKEASSGFTGCTLFDFDDDGTVETIYRSEDKLLVINGTDGSTRMSITCISRTQEEYPIVADVDGDGASEICVTCYTSNTRSFDPYSNSKFAQVRIYEADNGESWQPSRPVWNQHAYFNVNVNDDLTIPVEQQDHSVVFSNGVCTTGANRALNTFLVQSPILNEDGCSNYVTPDLDLGAIITATSAQCPESELDVTFSIGNSGDVAVSGTIPVSFYAGDPTQVGAVYLNTGYVQLANLDIGQTQQFTLTAQGIGGDYTLYMIINDAGGTPIPIDLTDFQSASIPECGDGTNNIGNVVVSSDPFALETEVIFDNRKCDPTYPNNGQASAWYEGDLVQLQDAYFETFEDLALNTTVDNGATSWSRTIATDTDWADIRSFNSSKMFEGKDTDGVVTWTSGTINISGLTNVSISLNMYATNTMEDTDVMNATYSVDGGAFVAMTNGAGAGNFSTLNPSATGISGSNIQVRVTINNNRDDEIHRFDNVRVQGYTTIPNQPLTESSGFTFQWFNDDPEVNPAATLLHTGSTYPSMAAGTFYVRGYFADGNCYSEVKSVTIGLVDSPTFGVHTYQVSSLTNCTSPNGSVRAFAYTPPLLPGGIPQDTLTTGFTFEWVFNSELVTVIGTGSQLNNLNAAVYRVYVTENLTGCTGEETATVTTTLADPNSFKPVATPVNITTCAGLGSVSAYVDTDPGAGVIQNTTNYTFRWYNGPVVKATPDFTGVTYTNRPAGTYTVVAVNNATSCISLPETVTVTSSVVQPAPTSVATNNNSCSANANGTITVDPDGAGSANPANFTYKWYKGNNTLNANLLPGAQAGSAYGAAGQ